MKITPKVKAAVGVNADNLKQGDTFLYRGGLHLIYEQDPEAVNLLTGKTIELAGYELVQPVDCTLTWKYKPTTETTKKGK